MRHRVWRNPSAKGSVPRGARGLPSGPSPACSTHQDYRRMIDEVELDAIIIATPDHHPIQAAMLALQAGLDVYLEGSSRNLVAIIQDAGFSKAWAPTSSEQKGTLGKGKLTEG